MKNIRKELDGAWEERGVIGSRVEIDGKKIVFLWRSAPVLETTFKADDSDGNVELILKDKGLRYKGTDKDYATVEKMVFYAADGKLEMTEHFPITGESRTVLTKTDRSRYGNYDIDDKVLSELGGTWKCGDDFFEINFSGDKMEFNGITTRVHALKPRSGYPEGHIIADADPSVEGWHGFSLFEYRGGALFTRMHVCDAPSVEYVFKKV